MILKRGDYVKWSSGEILKITELNGDGQYSAILLYDPNIEWKSLIGTKLSTNISVVPLRILGLHEIVAAKLEGLV